MDNFRRRNVAARQPQAVDGFFSKTPARPLARTSHDGRMPARSVAGPHRPKAQPIQGSIDNFRRREGFHASGHRSIQTGMSGTAGSLATPSATLNMALPAAEGRGRGRRSKHSRGSTPSSKFRTIRKWTFRSVVVSVVLVIVVGGALLGKGYLKLQKVFQGGSSAAALNADVDPTLLKGEGDGRVNILLLGIGGEKHSGGDLTDTIMVASVDPVNNQVVLFSIPRDLWTKMPNNYVGNYHKINAAYESGKYAYLGKQDQSSTDRKAIMAGFQGIDGVVERVAGIPIHYNAVVNFQAFSQAIDTVGGVSVNVPEKLYDPTMAWENGWNPVLADQGVNNFDGKHALIYVRSRETSSDFARAERQRAVMIALKDKVANMGTLTNPLKMSKLLSAFGDNVQTDISMTDMARLGQIMKKIPSTQVQSVGLAESGNSFVTTGNINGLSVVMPKAGLEDYSAIQGYIRTKLKDGYIAKENANITILNGTGTPGLATEKAEQLKSYGYNVGVVDNAPTDGYMQTQIIDLSKGSKKYTLNYLKKRFGVESTSTQLPTGIAPGAANIVIILGNDAATTTES